MEKKIILSGHESFIQDIKKLKMEIEEIYRCKVLLPVYPDYPRDYEKFDLGDKFNFSADFVKKVRNRIKNSDALVVANYEYRNIDSYVPSLSFLEMSLAYSFDKKIFLLDFFPEQENKELIMGMDPKLMSWNVDLIGMYLYQDD